MVQNISKGQIWKGTEFGIEHSEWVEPCHDSCEKSNLIPLSTLTNPTTNFKTINPEII
jgi:hypothetical protein